MLAGLIQEFDYVDVDFGIEGEVVLSLNHPVVRLDRKGLDRLIQTLESIKEKKLEEDTSFEIQLGAEDVE